VIINVVDVARAALIEAGRPDMAMDVRPNKAGWPSASIYATRDDELLVRAFWLAHITVHPDAVIEDHGINCTICWGRWTDARL